MARISKLQRKLESQDPNKIYKLSLKLKCNMVNDFVKWESLNGKVKTYNINELESQ